MKFLILTLCFCIAFALGGCSRYVQVPIDKLPDRDYEAILITNTTNPEGLVEIVVGDPDKAGKILNQEIQARFKVVDGCWIRTLTEHFLQAKRMKTPQYFDVDTRIMFLTKNRAYVLEISFDSRTVYGPGYQSEQLLHDFKEMGIVEEEKVKTLEEQMKLLKPLIRKK